MTPEKEQKLNELKNRKSILEANGGALTPADKADLDALEAEKAAENAPQGFKANPNYQYANNNGYSAGVVVGLTLNITGAEPDKRKTRDGQSEYDVLVCKDGRVVSLSALLRGASYATDTAGWNGTINGYINFASAVKTADQMALLNGKTSIRCIATKTIVGNFGPQTVALWAQAHRATALFGAKTASFVYMGFTRVMK